MNSKLKHQLEEQLNEEIVNSNSVSGGCIADSRRIQTKSGKKYFVKTHSGSKGMFLKEANGLKELSLPNAIRIPKVIHAADNYLLLEHIEQGSKMAGFFSHFGEQFATMHRYTNKSFGFFEDNYIGSTPQINSANVEQQKNWPEFYYQKRILQQLYFAEQNGYATSELSSLVAKLENTIEHILEGSEEPPTLLHGDLWGGNYLCDIENSAVLIDPAVYYGHREADLAMTHMFGGFSSEFYDAYNSAYPLKEGWQYREGIYLLYHYMNHLNLFGNSYYSQCIQLLSKYN
jgi:protein-ribulosamine 3-kinase